MLYILRRYLGEAFGHHFWEIVSIELLIGLTVGGLVAFGGGGALTATLDPGQLSQLLIAYASLALGVCLTAMSIIVRLADSEFADFLYEQDQQRLPSFDSVVFRISWTGTIHWVMLVVCLVITLISNAGPAGAAPVDGIILIAVLAGFFAYGVSMLFAALLTISYLGMARWQWLEDRHARGLGRPGDRG